MAAVLLEADRAAALKEFDDTKAGVKGLVDAGITTIPSIFHHPNFRPSRPPTPTDLSIPIVDLYFPHHAVVDQIRSSCRHSGFFQLVNHGIPTSVMAGAISAIKSFHELPADVRASHYTRDPNSSVTYQSNLDLFRADAACWRDTLRVHMGPVPPDMDMIPEVCRKELLAMDEQAKKVAAKVMGFICEGLGVAPTRLEELKSLEKRHMVANYYPSCPEPERTLGFMAHTDTALLTVLIQDQIGGLQVRMRDDDGDEYWIDVKPVPGALVVNVGDLLQILSNDVYKAGVHKVQANSHKEARVSIAVFFAPGINEASDLLGPLPELVLKKNPPKYRNFNMLEYYGAFLNKKLGTKSLIDHFKLSTYEN